MFFTRVAMSFAQCFQYLFPTYEAHIGQENYEIPIAIVVLVATGVSNFLGDLYCTHSQCQLYAALYEWHTREHQVTEFSANVYLDVYQGHVNTLKHIQEMCEGVFHLIMIDIYNQASKFSLYQMYISPDWSNTTLHLMKMNLSLALILLILILTISWAILKNAWPMVKDHMTEIANVCLLEGYHPIHWCRALVVVIPKPRCNNYNLTKNYQPISLLECMNKLIKKAMSKHFLHDVDHFRIIPITQFGTRAFSCTLDAGLMLTHDAQTALAAKMKCRALLFDIKGLFDNIHKDCLVATLENLGYPEGVTAWTLSFLSAQQATLSFNGLTTPEQDQPVGTPQGSPLLLVLLALYTSLMLKALNGSPNTSLAMYVNDGVIFAHGPDWETANTLLQEKYQECEEWLCHNNLGCKPEKTELIYFRRSRACDSPPDQLYLPDPSNHTYY